MQKFDFHCHSYYSDGALSPQQLVHYAAEREIDYLALTDHDSVDGLVHARAEIEQSQLSLSLINGIEISALCDYGEIHIVGLAIDPEHPALVEALANQQEQRWQRAKIICQKLEKAGVPGVFERLQSMVTQVVTRTHIAKVIVELGHAKDMQQAFKKYIGKQGRIKVPKNWMTLSTAIELIKQAGGTSVLAHPTRYPLSNNKLTRLIRDFAEAGGDAIEIAYPSLNPDKIAWLKIQQAQTGLMVSSGSDFHYPDLRWTDLGRFPVTDPQLPHVYHQIVSS